VQIVWDADRLEEVIENADHPVKYEPSDLPDDPAVVVGGDGWEAVVPVDRVIENSIMKRRKRRNMGSRSRSYPRLGGRFRRLRSRRGGRRAGRVR
jgi:hypothetical protein